VPLNWLGSSDIRALGEADALIYFPVKQEPYTPGEIVQTIPL
jgi:hypothetical protein